MKLVKVYEVAEDIRKDGVVMKDESDKLVKFRLPTRTLIFGVALRDLKRGEMVSIGPTGLIGEEENCEPIIVEGP